MLVSGLKPGALYRFRVRAKNDVAEWGPTSAESDVLRPRAVLPDAPQRPMPKQDVMIAGVNSRTSSLLSWPVPYGGGDLELRYELEQQQMGVHGGLSPWSASRFRTITEDELAHNVKVAHTNAAHMPAHSCATLVSQHARTHSCM